MRAATLSFSTTNIGDDMQALAAELFLKRVDARVDRDRLADATLDETHACILASWFLRGDPRVVPPPEIDPILFGFCAGLPEALEGPWLDYLRARAPVGARDLATVEWLAGHGVDAFWSGCVTLFMGRRLMGLREEPRAGVLFVDIDAETEAAWLAPELRADAERVTNHISAARAADAATRRASLVLLADRIARAEAVVTQRLHVALPAAGMGVPVLAIPDPRIGEADRRFSGFDSFLPTVYADEPPRRFSRADLAPVAIPDALQARAGALEAELERRGLLGDPADNERAFRAEVAAARERLAWLENTTGDAAPGRLDAEAGAAPVVWWSDRAIATTAAGGARIVPARDDFAEHVAAWLAGETDWEGGRLGPLEDRDLAGLCAERGEDWIAADLRKTGDLAARLIAHRKFAAAETLIAALLAAAPKRQRGHALAVDLDLARGDAEAALARLTALPAAADDGPVLRLAKARALRAAGEAEAAVHATARDAARDEPPVALAREHVLAAFAAGREDPRLDALARRVLAVRPRDLELREAYGGWLLARGDAATGRAILARLPRAAALRRRPNPVPAWTGEDAPDEAELLVLARPGDGENARAAASRVAALEARGWSVVVEITAGETEPGAGVRAIPAGALAAGLADWGAIAARATRAEADALIADAEEAAP